MSRQVRFVYNLYFIHTSDVTLPYVHSIIHTNITCKHVFMDYIIITLCLYFLIQNKARIFLFQSRNAPLMVTVYKITAWPFGQELPDSSKVVGDVANLLCDAPSIPDGGPTLFCCG